MIRSKSFALEKLDLARLLVARGRLLSVAGAGAIHEDAFLTVRRACFPEAFGHAFIARDVDFAEDAVDFLGDLFAFVFLQIEERDFDAVLRQRPRRRFAEAGGTARDDGGDRIVSSMVRPFPVVALSFGLKTAPRRREVRVRVARRVRLAASGTCPSPERNPWLHALPDPRAICGARARGSAYLP